MLALRNSTKPTLFEDVFDSFFDNNFWLNRSFNDYSHEPATYHFDEDNKEHVITVQAPGFKKEDIDIEVDGRGISLKGEINDESIKGRIGEKKFQYFMKKSGIDSKGVEATLDNGILSIRFKTEEEKKVSKKIAIK
jgi:HSP20 family molecular chaperone IbpA